MQIKMLLPTTTPIPPISPSQSATAPAPMIYIKRDPAWEYKRIVRAQDIEHLLTEDELNDLGKDGWELSGIVSTEESVNFYLKRLLD